MRDDFEGRTDMRMDAAAWFCGRLRLLLVAISCALAMQTAALAQEVPAPAPAAPTAAPARVEIGTYIVNIPSVDVAGSRYRAIFWLWFRWRDETLNPVESFEIVNGTVESREMLYTRTYPDGTRYARLRVTASLFPEFDLRRFPLDDHSLSIDIEGEQDESRFIFVPDTAETGHNPAISIPGWVLRDTQVTVAPTFYRTSYGEPDMQPGIKYTTYHHELDMVRPGWGYLARLVLPSYVAVTIALMALMLKPSQSGPRVSLGTGALFAMVANAFFITRSLPDSPVPTLMEMIAASSIITILLSIIMTVLTLRAQDAAGGDHRLERHALPGLIGLYALVQVSLFLFW